MQRAVGATTIVACDTYGLVYSFALETNAVGAAVMGISASLWVDLDRVAIVWCYFRCFVRCSCRLHLRMTHLRGGRGLCGKAKLEEYVSSGTYSSINRSSII